MKGTAKKTETYIDDRPGYDPSLEQEMDNIRNHPWSDGDIDKLVRYYGNVNTVLLAKRLGRTRAALAGKVREMGLVFPKKDKSVPAVNKGGVRRKSQI